MCVCKVCKVSRCVFPKLVFLISNINAHFAWLTTADLEWACASAVSDVFLQLFIRIHFCRFLISTLPNAMCFFNIFALKLQWWLAAVSLFNFLIPRPLDVFFSRGSPFSNILNVCLQRTSSTYRQTVEGLSQRGVDHQWLLEVIVCSTF